VCIDKYRGGPGVWKGLDIDTGAKYPDEQITQFVT